MDVCVYVVSGESVYKACVCLVRGLIHQWCSTGGRNRSLALDSGSDLDNVFLREIRFVAERAENGIFFLEQVQRSVELGDLARVHDEDAIIVHCLSDQPRV